MKFDSTKKQAIISYILEKIDEDAESVSLRVAETFGISQNTVHTYLRELLDNNIIKRGKRGKYELVSEQYEYVLNRESGELDDDMFVYSKCLLPHISTLPDNVKQIWQYAVSEMTNNVIDHSGAKQLSVTIKTDHLKTEVYLDDNGIGIFNKIKEHFGFSEIDDAICELFKGKITTDAANHSGEGVFFTSRIMDKFWIVSSGKVFSSSKFDNDEVVNQIDLPGTCVYMALSNSSHKSMSEIFNLYSNLDGGFTRTSIPLRLVFDSAPVSRSQAKRITYRLDDFKEVELDFKDIDWMGQGFAHQLFVLYAKAHPDTKLIPVNMEKGVSEMYEHVIAEM